MFSIIRKRRLSRTVVAAVAGTGLLSGVALAATGSTVGPRPDGTAVNSAGYGITPAGAQTRLGDLPLASALSPDGRTLLVSNDGQGQQALQVVDAATGAVRQSIPYTSPEALYQGLAFSPDGRLAYASAGGNNKVRVYAVHGQTLSEQSPIVLPTTAPDGTTVNMYAAGLAISPDGRYGYVADQLADAVTVLDLEARTVLATVGVGHNPLAVALGPDGRTAYVANQGAQSVSVVDVHVPTHPRLTSTVSVGTHPDAFALDKRSGELFVANGDSDNVSVLDTASNQVVRTISLAPYPGAPVGSNPDALALAPGGLLLAVAEAGTNAVDIVNPRSGKRYGMIPTGWYPSSLALAHNGRTLYVTNAKGLGAGPNDGPGYPNPTSSAPTAPDEYSGSMIAGTLSRIPTPGPAGLHRYTAQVVANDGFAQGSAVRGPANAGNPVPHRVGQPSPIKHVIYVVKENRTYDQEFGSLGKGNGDASLNLFGQDSAPNSRDLQRRFTTLDNYYADAEVSADGWNWSTAANANRYVQGTWVANYSNRNHPYDYEGGNLATAPNVQPTDAYIWDRLSDAGISYRNYGFFTFQNSSGQNVTDTTDPVLNAHTDHNFVGFNLACPDHPDSFVPRSLTCGLPRISEWQREFGYYVRNDNLPSVEFLRLPSDHTSGTYPGRPTPRAYVGDNDWALGQLVDSVSHSKYWSSTAIFVTEDDAQNGPDHVDAHRTIAQVISPYTQHGRVDSTLYSTGSMLRTIELIAGIGPLTQFDTYATPMSASFTAAPNLTPYTALEPSTELKAVNPSNAPMAATARRQDLSREDRIDMHAFNQEIWQSVKGAGVPMPAPRHLLRTVPAGTDSDS